MSFINIQTQECTAQRTQHKESFSVVTTDKAFVGVFFS